MYSTIQQPIDPSLIDSDAGDYDFSGDEVIYHHSDNRSALLISNSNKSINTNIQSHSVVAASHSSSIRRNVVNKSSVLFAKSPRIPTTSSGLSQPNTTTGTPAAATINTPTAALASSSWNWGKELQSQLGSFSPVIETTAAAAASASVFDNNQSIYPINPALISSSVPSLTVESYLDPVDAELAELSRQRELKEYRLKAKQSQQQQHRQGQGQGQGQRQKQQQQQQHSQQTPIRQQRVHQSSSDSFDFDSNINTDISSVIDIPFTPIVRNINTAAGSASASSASSLKRSRFDLSEADDFFNYAVESKGKSKSTTSAAKSNQIKAEPGSAASTGLISGSQSRGRGSSKRVQRIPHGFHEVDLRQLSRQKRTVTVTESSMFSQLESAVSTDSAIRIKRENELIDIQTVNELSQQQHQQHQPHQQAPLSPDRKPISLKSSLAELASLVSPESNITHKVHLTNSTDRAKRKQRRMRLSGSIPSGELSQRLRNLLKRQQTELNIQSFKQQQGESAEQQQQPSAQRNLNSALSISTSTTVIDYNRTLILKLLGGSAHFGLYFAVAQICTPINQTNYTLINGHNNNINPAAALFASCAPDLSIYSNRLNIPQSLLIHCIFHCDSLVDTDFCPGQYIRINAPFTIIQEELLNKSKSRLLINTFDIALIDPIRGYRESSMELARESQRQNELLAQSQREQQQQRISNDQSNSNESAAAAVAVRDLDEFLSSLDESEVSKLFQSDSKQSNSDPDNTESLSITARISQSQSQSPSQSLSQSQSQCKSIIRLRLSSIDQSSNLTNPRYCIAGLLQKCSLRGALTTNPALNYSNSLAYQSPLLSSFILRDNSGLIEIQVPFELLDNWSLIFVSPIDTIVYISGLTINHNLAINRGQLDGIHSILESFGLPGIGGITTVRVNSNSKFTTRPGLIPITADIDNNRIQLPLSIYRSVAINTMRSIVINNNSPTVQQLQPQQQQQQQHQPSRVNLLGRIQSIEYIGGNECIIHLNDQSLVNTDSIDTDSNNMPITTIQIHLNLSLHIKLIRAFFTVEQAILLIDVRVKRQQLISQLVLDEDKDSSNNNNIEPEFNYLECDWYTEIAIPQFTAEFDSIPLQQSVSIQSTAPTISKSTADLTVAIDPISKQLISIRRIGISGISDLPPLQLPLLQSLLTKRTAFNQPEFPIILFQSNSLFRIIGSIAEVLSGTSQIISCNNCGYELSNIELELVNQSANNKQRYDRICSRCNELNSDLTLGYSIEFGLQSDSLDPLLSILFDPICITALFHHLPTELTETILNPTVGKYSEKEIKNFTFGRMAELTCKTRAINNNNTNNNTTVSIQSVQFQTVSKPLDYSQINNSVASQI